MADCTSDKLTILNPLEWFQVRNGYANIEPRLVATAVQYRTLTVNTCNINTGDVTKNTSVCTRRVRSFKHNGVF